MDHAEICSHFGLRTADPSPLANPPTEHPTTAMADLVEPTRPQNAYWLWLRENRNALAEEAGTGNFSVVGKLAGEKWKAMKDAQKAPFEKQAAELKATYEKAMEQFVAAGGQKGKRRQEKAAANSEGADNNAKKKAGKNSCAPKRPTNAYVLWRRENRKSKRRQEKAAANSEGADNKAEKKARKNTSRHCGRQNRPHSHSGYHKMKARVWKAEELAKEAAADAAAQATRAEAQAIRAKELERQLSEERRRMHLLQDTIEWAQTVRRFGGPDVDLRRRTRDLAML